MSALLGIINTRLIISHFGEAAFVQYGLLVGIGALLPFADLGISAAIINVVGGSKNPTADEQVRKVLTTSIRVLVGSFAVLSAICLAISASGSWPWLLGRGLVPGSGATAATLCGLLIAATLLFGFGQRILIALDKNHVSIALLGLQTPLVLLGLLVIVGLDAPLGSYVAVLAYAATFVLSVIGAIMASRLLRPVVGRAVRDAVHVRTVRGGQVFHVAWPMLIQMIALPIAMQSDRLVLSHVSTIGNLAAYNLAAQIFTPIWSVINSAGAALWPVFARARAQHTQSRTSPASLAIGFGGVAAGVSLALALVSPWLAAVSSDGQIRLSVGLIVAFALFMVVQGVKYPLGMYMTDAAGLRFQAVMILLLLPINLGLSIWLTHVWGAAGPVVGSAVSVFLCQVVANWLYVRRDLARRSVEPSDEVEGDPVHAPEIAIGIALEEGPDRPI